MKSFQVARLLAYVTGLINQELLLQVEYLAAENRILRAYVPIRLRLSNGQRSTLAEIVYWSGSGGQREWGNSNPLNHAAWLSSRENCCLT